MDFQNKRITTYIHTVYFVVYFFDYQQIIIQYCIDFGSISRLFGLCINWHLGRIVIFSSNFAAR